MIDIQLSNKQLGQAQIHEIGLWLDATMPNPPLPEPQRWEIGVDDTGYRTGIRFYNEQDAMIFKLRW